MTNIDVKDCAYYRANGKCSIPHYQQGIKFVSCSCHEWDCDYKQRRLQIEELHALESKVAELEKSVRDNKEKRKQSTKKYQELKDYTNLKLDNYNKCFSEIERMINDFCSGCIADCTGQDSCITYKIMRKLKEVRQ